MRPFKTVYVKRPAMRPYDTEYVKGIVAIVTKAGKASPMYDQLTDVTWRIIMHPTRMRVHPVAHGGMEANIGAKKIDTRKQTPVVIAVRPVRPPSVIPAPDSTKHVTGEQPTREPMEIMTASVQYARVERGKSPVSRSTTPEKRAIEYKVADASIMSTYRKVNSAKVKCRPPAEMSQS